MLPSRRRFLQVLGAGLVAAAAPEFVLPHPRTIIDMMPRYASLWAQDGDDVSDLMRYIAPGGTLYVHGVSVSAARTLRADRDRRLVMRSSILRFQDMIGVELADPHRSGLDHEIIQCHLIGTNRPGSCGILFRPAMFLKG